MRVYSDYKPGIFIDGVFLVDTYFSELRGDGWVRGKGSNGSSSTFGEGLEKVELQRNQDGRDSFPGMTHSSVDQQHRTTCEFEGARSGHNPAIFMDSGFLVEAALEMLGGGAQSMFDG